ncbi:Bud site selection protein 22 [Diplodia seriata]|uniref:Bud site selection protein 22 n=1 Tax=Diplodia seriata TaxID=420778 RepID=A0A1S8BGJ9_9PEZI|nr:Bud site selection protein 22 [Diplodia seriata]
MPKRKRDDRSASNRNTSYDSDAAASSPDHQTTKKTSRNAATTSSTTTTTAKQRKNLPARLEQGKKQLVKALKVARGFERQKLSRRRKTAATDKNEGGGIVVARIDREIEALKRMDYAKVAERQLYRTLLKIKSVREHEALPPWVVEKGGLAGEGVLKVVVVKKDGEGGEGGEVLPAAQLAKEAMDVQARLFNAHPTKEAMAEVVRDVRAILGLDDEAKGPPRAKRARGEEKAGKKAKVVESSSGEDDGEEEEVGDEESGEENGGDEAEWDSEEFAGFSDRIAASSDSESEGEDVEIKLKKGAYQPVRDLSFTPPSSREASPSASSEPAFSDEEEEESSEQEPRAKSKSKEKAAVVANKSTFLPSLSAVGYISGSDSEAEDLDDEIAPPKKNRRGQRARQQLWEKKYGKGAKHLAKQTEKQKKDRNAGWDAKRGAVDGDGGRKGKFGRDKRDFSSGGRGPKATDANLVELGKKKNHRDDGGKLHPSWEAAKLAKEKAKLGNAQFQGKKITFD